MASLREEEKVKKTEDKILRNRAFYGKVGQIHQGLSTFGLWGVRDNGKIKFKSSKFQIFDDKLLIERNKNIVQFSDIQEIFQERRHEAIILLNNGNGIPIRGKSKNDLKAFVNVLNKLIEDYKSKSNVEIINGENNENETIDESENKVDRLIKLGEMYEKGLLSSEEFDLMKKSIIEEK